MQFLIFPPLCSYFGVLNCFKACAVTFPIVYLVTPFTTLIEDETTRIAMLLAVMTVKACCVIIGFPCTTILLTNSATSLNILGTLNGFATTFSALGRASGPASAGSAFTWGVRRGIIAVPWWMLAVIAAIGAVPAWYIEEGDGPSASTPTPAPAPGSDIGSDDTVIEDDERVVSPEASRSRAIVFADGANQLNAREDDSVIHDPTGHDDLPLVGSMRSNSGMSYTDMTRQGSVSKHSGQGYGSFRN